MSAEGPILQEMKDWAVHSEEAGMMTSHEMVISCAQCSKNRDVVFGKAP